MENKRIPSITSTADEEMRAFGWIAPERSPPTISRWRRIEHGRSDPSTLPKPPRIPTRAGGVFELNDVTDQRYRTALGLGSIVKRYARMRSSPPTAIPQVSIADHRGSRCVVCGDSGIASPAVTADGLWKREVSSEEGWGHVQSWVDGARAGDLAGMMGVESKRSLAESSKGSKGRSALYGARSVADKEGRWMRRGCVAPRRHEAQCAVR
ncbi:hypothetical protein FB451DRAFT_1192570 [Mycena latifolia]|nr:hypothetical protein FB451DRAFT_1192570 [Mycena latifolia]